MRYLIGVPVCLVLVSGFLWWNANGSYHVGAEEVDAQPPVPEAVFRPAKAPQAQSTAQPEEGTIAFDPIVVSPCTLTPIQEQSVASQIDGLLTESLVALGTKVKKGQRLAQLDDQKLRLQIDLLKIKATSESAEKIARAHFEEADAKVKYAQKANETGLTSVPELEMKTYLAERERYANEMEKAREDRAEAAKELEKAKVHLEMHQIVSALDGEVIKTFKKLGETVKQGETLFRLTRIDRLRIEGFCKVQHAPFLRPGQPVSVEAELQGAQAAALIGHTGGVNGLAISGDGKVLASASDDGSVMLWSWPGGNRLATLNHPAPVSAVDIVKLQDDGEGRYLIVTGGEDRLIRVWTWSGSKATGPIHEIAGHEGTVRALCLAGDGKSLASGGEDRRVGWWDLSAILAGKGSVRGPLWAHTIGAWKKTAHQGAVTSIQLLTDGTLISTGSDNVQKVWQIKGNEIGLAKTHRGRSGDVARLNIGRDGHHLLMDHGDELRIVDRLSGTVEGTLHNTRHVRFEEFAQFSPSRRLILSASAEGRLQLWRAPVESKERAEAARALKSGKLQGQAPNLGGFEIRQYPLPKASQARCSVFAPDESVFFSGGSDRMIRVWSIPAVEDWSPRPGVLTYVGSELEPGTDLVHIQAEMDNPVDAARWWRPGTYVHLKIYPSSR